MRRFRAAAVAVALTAAVAMPVARAADHVDGPRASADPSADITDVFAWMSPDAHRVFLVMDLVRNAGTGSRFSDKVQYVFHTASRPAFAAPAASAVDIICEFSKNQEVRCWVGDQEFVRGDASSTNGLTSADGRVRIFTGLRDDPFFFNLSGFRATARAVTTAASGLTFDPAGCPALDAATSTALVTQLRTAPDGSAAKDDFARFNVIAIVLDLDKSLLTAGGPILSMWASTNRE